MTMRWAAAVLVAIAMATGAHVWAVPATQTITVPTFGTVTIYQPDGAPRKQVLALITAADSGWLTSCGMDVAISPMVITRLTCASSACAWAFVILTSRT